MEPKKSNPEELLENETELEESAEENKMSEEMLSEKDKRLDEIQFRIHEIDLVVEELEELLYNEEDETHYETLLALKQELKELRKEQKAIRKSEEVYGWDKVPLWIFIYGILQFILSSFLIMPWLTVYFFDAVAPFVRNALDSNAVVFLLIFGLTIVNFFITGILLLFVWKKKIERIAMISVWVLQLISTITTVVTLWGTFQNFIAYY